MANSLWVTVCSWLYLWQSDSLPLWQQQVSMAACSLCQAISSDPTLDQQGVSDTASLLSCNSVIILHATSHWSPTACEITSYFFCPTISSHAIHLMTNREWVALQPHLICHLMWQKASEWHFPLCFARQSHHIVITWKRVCDTAIC